MTTRRTFLKGSTTSLASLALPMKLRAETPAGTGTLITVSDGHLDLPKSFLLGSLEPGLADPILAKHGLTGDTLRQPCNVTLFRDADRTVLFDVGSGTDFLPTAGALLDSLDAAGVLPEDITNVIFTHGHPDHLWGLLDDFDDPAFPEAAFHIGKTEWEYWTDPTTVDEIGEARQAFAVGAKRRLESIEDQISLFDDGQEVLSGIEAIATYGHTPGHMAFQVGAKNPVFVIGDAIVNAHLALANPAWELGSDHDPETAAATRVALVNRLATGGHHLAGFHLPGSGIGHIEAAGEGGFRFIEDNQ